MLGIKTGLLASISCLGVRRWSIRCIVSPWTRWKKPHCCILNRKASACVYRISVFLTVLGIKTGLLASISCLEVRRWSIRCIFSPWTRWKKWHCYILNRKASVCVYRITVFLTVLGIKTWLLASISYLEVLRWVNSMYFPCWTWWKKRHCCIFNRKASTCVYRMAVFLSVLGIKTWLLPSISCLEVRWWVNSMYFIVPNKLVKVTLVYL